MHLYPREAQSLQLGPAAEAHPQHAAVHLYPDQAGDPTHPHHPPEPNHICQLRELSHA